MKIRCYVCDNNDTANEATITYYDNYDNNNNNYIPGAKLNPPPAVLPVPLVEFDPVPLNANPPAELLLPPPKLNPPPILDDPGVEAPPAKLNPPALLVEGGADGLLAKLKPPEL